MPASQKNAAKRKKKSFFQLETLPLHLMALPVLVYLLIFCYTPMIGLVMAFQDLNISKGVFSSPFVGLKNFEFLFHITDDRTTCHSFVKKESELIHKARTISCNGL